jgi:ribosomal-protein-alanine N-acetyltransferase
MNHQGTNLIETSRLCLRRFKIEDAEQMFLNWGSDDEVTKYLTWQTHKNVDETRELLVLWIKYYENKDNYNWVIEIKETKTIIGSISVVEIKEKIEAVTIGYCIGKKWWNLGYTSESLISIVSYLFEEIKVNRIEAYHDVRNVYSGKVMQTAGMKFEGTKREGGHNNQGICDQALYGIVARDYFKKD